MTVTDIATRTYNHGWRLDPVVRSLLNTDFYKLLMLQMIRKFYPDKHVTFSVIDRSRHVRIAEAIDECGLCAQLDHARSIRFSKKATGEPSEIERYLHVFGNAGCVRSPVHV